MQQPLPTGKFHHGDTNGVKDISEIPFDERKAIKGTEDAIIAIEFEMSRKMKAVKRTEQKMELSENEKIRIGAEYALQRNIKTLIDYFKKTINAHLGRMPPQATDIEQTVLGAIILERPALEHVKKFLKPKHFYHQHHELIYTAILQLGDNPVDMRTVVNQMRVNGTLEIIGSPAYIAELTAMVSSAANVEYHARVVIEYAIKRELLLMGSRIMLDAYDDRVSCFDLLDNVKDTLNEIGEWTKK